MNYAHLHLIFNHVPVFGAIATLALAGYVAFTNNEAIAKLALWFMVLIGVLTLPAYFSGEPAEEVVEHLPGVTESLINAHENYALIGLILTEVLALAALIGILAIKKLPFSPRAFWRLLATIAVANGLVMMATANLGGEIRHTEIRRSASPAGTPAEPKPESAEERRE